MKHSLSNVATVRMRSVRSIVLPLLASLVLNFGLALRPARAVDPPRTRRVSVDSDGVEGNARSVSPVISGNGRYVLFESEADNLVENDENDREDYFILDRRTGVIELISVSSNGEQGNDNSRSGVHITPDGRYVAFSSGAWNFDERDCETCGGADVFVRDRALGLTILVSVSSEGIKGNGQSGLPSISPDGRYVVFISSSNNLVEGDTNRRHDVFIHDRDADDNGVFDEDGGISTIRMTVGYDGEQSDGTSLSPRVTPDGRFIVFDSDATNLVPGDTNQFSDVFVHDRDADENGIFDEPGGVETERVSIGFEGREGDGPSRGGSITPDGQFVVFSSVAGNLFCCDDNERSDVFLHDRKTDLTWLISWGRDGRSGNAGSGDPAISADGRLVTFASGATNLVETDDDGPYADIFVYNRDTGEMTLVSLSTDGEQGNSDDGGPAFTDDGCSLVFESQSDNLVDDDTNEARDIFFRDLGWCVPGDINGDGVTDLADFAILEACLQGPTVRATEACASADLDLDLDVDLYDFTILQSDYTGP